MDSITNDNIQTNFLIALRPKEIDQITPEVNRQYFRLSIIGIFIFLEKTEHLFKPPAIYLQMIDMN